jgi:hypothetical protein
VDRRRLLAIASAILATPLATVANKRRRKKKRRRRRRDDIPNHPSNLTTRNSVSRNGTGSATTETFFLDAGPYLASADLYGYDYVGEQFIVRLNSDLGLTDYLFIEDPNDGRNFRYERSFEVRESGWHFMQVEEHGGRWHLHIVPRCVPPEFGCRPLPPPLPPLPPAPLPPG